MKCLTMKKNLIIFTVVLLVILAIAFPKPYALSGGIGGMGKTRECKCIGFEYSYYPDGFIDAMTTYYCAGIPYECTEAHALDIGTPELIIFILTTWGIIALIMSLVLWVTSKRLRFRNKDHMTALCVSVLGYAFVLTSSAFGVFLGQESSYGPGFLIIALLLYGGFTLHIFLMHFYVIFFYLLLIRRYYKEGWRNTLKATAIMFLVWFLVPFLIRGVLKYLR